MTHDGTPKRETRTDRRRGPARRRAAVLAWLVLWPVMGSVRVSGQVEAPAPVPTQPPVTAPAPAPAPAPTQPPVTAPAPGTPAPEALAQPPIEMPRPVSDLDPSKRFRFIERYVRERDPARAASGEVSTYKVASRDVIRVVNERSQGAPSRTERTVQVIYTERPAIVTSSGVVTDTVRRYEAFRTTPADPGVAAAGAGAGQPLVGLTVWHHKRPTASGISAGATLISLDADRSITETEFAISQRQLFLPDLVGALPALPSRVGDRWRVPPGAAQALLGERPMGRSEPLSGTLTEVRKKPDGGGYTATIAVAGRALLPEVGETVLNAQLLFEFGPPADLDKLPTVDARGWISQVRLARTSTGTAPGSNGRLRSMLGRELVLERRPTPDTSLPNVPEKAPEETQANSWLTYEDPRGRFHFRHPEDLLPQRLPMFEQDDMVQLGDAQAGTDEGHIVTLRLQPKSDDPAADRESRDPDFHLKSLKEDWARTRQDVLPGPTGWLPEADWAPFNMRVYRIQAALRPSQADGREAQRIYADHYLVLFSRNETLAVDAMTGQDPPTQFRETVEAMLKTFKLTRAPGPARPAPATPAPAQPASPAQPPGT